MVHEVDINDALGAPHLEPEEGAGASEGTGSGFSRTIEEGAPHLEPEGQQDKKIGEGINRRQIRGSNQQQETSK